MKRFLLISLTTTVIFYLVTSFVFWDIFIIKKVRYLPESNRVMIVVVYLLKCLIDALLFMCGVFKTK